MICYQDIAFCASKVKKHTCGREITKEEIKDAEKIGLPIAYGYFCKPKGERMKDLKDKILEEAGIELNKILNFYSDKEIIYKEILEQVISSTITRTVEEIEKEFVSLSPAILPPKIKDGYLLAMEMFKKAKSNLKEKK